VRTRCSWGGLEGPASPALGGGTLETPRAGRFRPLSIGHRADPASAGGFGLIECMVYFGVVVIVLGLAVAAFDRVQKQTAWLGRNAVDIVRAVQAGERWRADIREATGTPRWIGSGANRELLVPHPRGGIAYSFHDKTVWRRSSPGVPWEPWLERVTNSQMLEDERRPVLAWRWDLELEGRQKIARVRPLFSFLAVPPQPNSP
jgi:hypothetical protein